MIALLPERNGHAPKPPELQGGDPLEYVSVSRLKSFLSCRLKFYFDKVLALRRPVPSSFHFGKAVHAALQHYNKARWRGGDTSETAIIAAFDTAFRNPEKGEQVEWESPEEFTELHAKGEPLLRAFLASNVHPVTDKPMGVEVTMKAELPSLALPLLGVVDLVKANRTPVDYKTVGATPNPSVEAWLHELQLTAYTLLVEEATGELCPGSELVFLVKTKTPKIIPHALPPPTSVQRDRFARLVEVYANAVANAQYYPSPGMHCAWCSYRSECSTWKGGRL